MAGQDRQGKPGQGKAGEGSAAQRRAGQVNYLQTILLGGFFIRSMQLKPGVVDGLPSSHSLCWVPLQQPLQHVNALRGHVQKGPKVKGNALHGHGTHDIIQGTGSALIHALPALARHRW